MIDESARDVVASFLSSTESKFVSSILEDARNIDNLEELCDFYNNTVRDPSFPSDNVRAHALELLDREIAFRFQLQLRKNMSIAEMSGLLEQARRFQFVNPDTKRKIETMIGDSSQRFEV